MASLLRRNAVFRWRPRIGCASISPLNPSRDRSRSERFIDQQTIPDELLVETLLELEQRFAPSRRKRKSSVHLIEVIGAISPALFA